MLPNNECVNQEIKEEIKKKNAWRPMKMVTRWSKIFGIFIATQAYFKKQVKISNEQPNLTPKQTTFIFFNRMVNIFLI